ncbi:hypothetical protein SAY86_024448 [Trapa natans]|uniref:TSL-kinase interacting protein 1 n=1 Tax=Trapa natans TaxID=22666 RepID=A0AAN7RJP4_TRANT|nr:hypothetical protein SAY86_024448 [Trapa natans]
MLTEQQDSLVHEAHLQSEGALTSDENASASSLTFEHSVLHQPAKRPTRQWAAWTREEEESFFTALRQVGKNFEKITCRVQSKNKDQVRHYYYRLVRRMNKLLGPRLCLDAKNSKDTNAAMLRWWSLLEKYSFKASKLHLKPRRFKIFVEALEHQLLKDRKKSVRKRSQGENSSSSQCSLSSMSRPPSHDNHTVKMVLVDSQNVQKLGPGKPIFKRTVSLGMPRGNNKGESAPIKQPRQRRKPSFISSTAYKKWEKAAIAGVSLVADAAEHIERTASDLTECAKLNAAEHIDRTAADLTERAKLNAAAVNLNCTAIDAAQYARHAAADKDSGRGQRQEGPDPGGELLPDLSLLTQNNHTGGMQATMKLKLQLFPVDDGTRRALEMDKHNPHLELTLSTRKKISSVIEHLNRKWGGSSVADGELVLFPYGVRRDNLMNCAKWTEDSICSAADVYAMAGCPPVFRLWYGWIRNTGTVAESFCFPGDNLPSPSNSSKNVGDVHRDQQLSVAKKSDVLSASNNVREQINSYATDISAMSHSEISENMKQNDGDVPRISNNAAFSAGEWADSIANISVGDLLLEAAQSDEATGHETDFEKALYCVQKYTISVDSFDAAVAAHVSKYQDKVAVQSSLPSHISASIWDAEETCDAFSFRKNTAHEESPCGNMSSVATEALERESPAGSTGLIEECEVETTVNNPACDDPAEEYLSDDQNITENPTKDFSLLADIYWPESLGPLDLDIPAPTYQCEDLILRDSFSYLNRLIASSLDTFQNYPFFGSEKETDPVPVEARESAPFRISSGV